MKTSRVSGIAHDFRHAQPHFGGREHLREPLIIAEWIYVRVHFNVAHMRTAVHPLEKGLEQIKRLFTTAAPGKGTGKVVAHHQVVGVKKKSASNPLKRP